ncbi:MAG TPA: hypothetical protein VGF46_09475 [Gaiellales bacterium]|jgi:hypothetical protein
MPSSADPQTCAVCRRHFLQGEAVRLYREASGPTFRRVCALCLDAAATRGWEPSEATRVEPMRVHADPMRAEAAVARDRIVERLQAELEAVQRQLVGVRGSFTEAESRAFALERDRDGLASLPSELRAVERERDSLAGEVDRLSQALAQATLSERRLERAERRVRELEAELVDANAEADRVRTVRRREADPAYLRGIAAVAFNRSSQAPVVAAAARRHGEPRCRLAAEGVGLPRSVRATFFWDDAWYEFMISLDLAERSVRVDEIGRGDSPSDLPISRLHENAAWTPGNGLIADP